jgi:hypothetical protein
LAKPLALEMRQFLDYEMPRTLLNAFHLLRQDDHATDDFRRMLARIGKIEVRGLAAHLSQETEIAILNDTGDARINFCFEVANLGLVAQSERVHQFWFEQPQGTIEFKCADLQGTEIAAHVRAASPCFREIVLLLPRPLRPLESLQYEITFEVEREFGGHQNYSLCPRTITDLVSLSVLSAPRNDLAEVHVVHESVDGYLHDDPPLVTISREGPCTRLAWEARFPRPGDFLRTSWCSCLRRPRLG